MSKITIVVLAAALAVAVSLPAGASYSGSGNAGSLKSVGTDRPEYFKLDRLRADGSSLMLSGIEERTLQGASAAA